MHIHFVLQFDTNDLYLIALSYAKSFRSYDEICITIFLFSDLSVYIIWTINMCLDCIQILTLECLKTSCILTHYKLN